MRLSLESGSLLTHATAAAQGIPNSTMAMNGFSSSARTVVPIAQYQRREAS